MENYTIIQTCTSFPTKSRAFEIAKLFVAERSVACAQISDNTMSIYHWNGVFNQDKEVLMTLKTPRSMYKEVESRIMEHHPYVNPEIIGIPVIMGSEKYMSWLRKQSTERRDG